MLASTFVYGGIQALRNAPALAEAAKPVNDGIRVFAKKVAPSVRIPDDDMTMVRINAGVHILAGLGLAGFSAGLLGLYLRIPGMRQNGSLRPTPQGTPLAKDAWLLGIGLSFVLDAILSRGDDTG